MEINGLVSQLPFYRVAQNEEVKKDVLKGIKPINDQYSESKLDKEKSFSKFCSEDIYDLGFRTATKNIMDLNIPLSDSCGGGYGGG